MTRSEYQDAAESPKTLGHQQSARRKRILIVEDDPRSMMLLNDFLKAKGYETLQTSAGRDAINLARNERPDLILMDIRLPDISGLDATRLLKEDDQTKDIPIIAVTAFMSPGDEANALESGCDAYLGKPVKIGSLLRIVESFFSSSRPSAANPQ
jgi:two-component system cell cycle response regulator DivK